MATLFATCWPDQELGILRLIVFGGLFVRSRRLFRRLVGVAPDAVAVGDFGLKISPTNLRAEPNLVTSLKESRMTVGRTKPSTRSRVVRSLRKLVEFKGIHRSHAVQYRTRIRKLYDGPQGAAIRFSSVLSLHDPLVGRMLSSGQFDVSRFGHVLDVGSGSGQILKHIIRHVRQDARIVACDLSYHMLRRARLRFECDKVAYVAADIQSLPFADGAFDCITCGWVIEHLADPTPGLREMARVLKPGGSLLLMATEDTITGAMSSRTWKCRTYNRQELQAACESVGLVWHKPLWFTRIHRALRLGGILVEAIKTAQ